MTGGTDVRVDIYNHSDPQILALMKIMNEKLTGIINEGTKQMALGQDILDAVTAEGTAVDSIIALLNGLVANNTIDQATATAIMAEISNDKAKLEAAITAHTP